jgi:hypothetical protein
MVTRHLAAIRTQVSKIPGVSNTWLEWDLEVDHAWTMAAMLVVEVECHTDPNSPDFRKSVLDAIETTAVEMLMEAKGMALSRVRIVPKRT